MSVNILQKGCRGCGPKSILKQIIKHLLIDYQYLKLHHYYIERIGQLFNLKINELEMISKHFKMIYEH